MGVALVTGSGGLVGSEAATHFGGLGMDVVGVDNDMRKAFFGAEASTADSAARLGTNLGSRYRHVDVDIRDREAILSLVSGYAGAIEIVIHTAAQPSHDWAVKDPFTDFDINATGTLNLLEATRRHAPDAVFIFTSTNKVYGDTPNRLPLVELATRWEIDADHTYANGIREDMSIDGTLHSLFGASKVAADILVQEYGRYFQMRTACFRAGTITGPQHAATQLHGFLAYVMRCLMTRTPYTIFGYGGKQVRDAIHSSDLVSAFEAFYRSPGVAEVFNIGGGRFSNASVIEAIALGEELVGEELTRSYTEQNRIGDHVWYVGDNARFQSQRPEWRLTYDIPRILEEIYEANVDRWVP